MSKYKELPTDKVQAQRAYEELQKQLELARLEVAAYREMINIAEEELGLPIKKKRDSNQS